LVRHVEGGLLRQNYLTVPRQLPLFDELVLTVRQSRFTFREEDLLKTLWLKGEECHLGEDPRFRPTRWGSWCLQEQRPANQDLLTRLVQTWDGTDLQSMLAALDAPLKSWCVFDIADNRLKWDGQRLRMAQLPLHARDNPAGTCAEGWLPLWRSSQLTPEKPTPRPQYLHLRRAVRPDHFAVYLDSKTDLGPPGMLMLCSENAPGITGIGCDDWRLGHCQDGEFGHFEAELFLRDLFDLQAEEALPQMQDDYGPPFESSQGKGPSSGFRPVKKGSPRCKAFAAAKWVLDRAGGLYAYICSSFPDDNQKLCLESGQELSPGQFLPQRLGTTGIQFFWGADSWRLEPPDQDRISLFRASDREKSVMLSTRCLTKSGSRRWLIPPSLRSQAEPLTNCPGVSLLANESDWLVLETEPDMLDIPASLLDSLGLRGAPGRPSIEFRGKPPVASFWEDEPVRLGFLASSPPDIWIDSINCQTMSHPYLIVEGSETRDSLALHGEAPWRVQIGAAEVGVYQIQVFDKESGLCSDRVVFELLAAVPDRFFGSIHWLDESGSVLDARQLEGLDEFPTGLCLAGPACWPLDVDWASAGSRSYRSFALDSNGRLSWNVMSASLGLPRNVSVKLHLRLRGLCSIQLNYQQKQTLADWEALGALVQTKFWPLRKLSSLNQCFENLIAPILSQAGLEPQQLVGNLWVLRKGDSSLFRLWVARKKDWPQTAQVVEESHLSNLIVTDGLDWARHPEYRVVSLEDCLQNKHWQPLQALFETESLP
jgi:hypothetical protein